MNDDGKKFYKETLDWLKSLASNLKGDTWEIEIMAYTVREVVSRVQDAEKGFLTKAKAQ